MRITILYIYFLSLLSQSHLIYVFYNLSNLTLALIDKESRHDLSYDRQRKQT